jgi:hypothetical protein
VVRVTKSPGRTRMDDVGYAPRPTISATGIPEIIRRAEMPSDMVVDNIAPIIAGRSPRSSRVCAPYYFGVILITMAVKL